MISLPHLFTKARRFIDGVCKVPDQLELIREAIENYDPQGWRSKANELLADLVQCRAMHHVLETELAAEREAHEETKQRWATVSDEWNGAADECIELRKQLSAARCWSGPCGVCRTRFDTLIYPRCPVCSGGPVQLTPVSIVEMIPCGRCGSRPNADEPQYDTITICPSCNRDRESRCEQLSAARADLEALTQLKDARIEPPPEHAAYDMFSMTWRHTPESLAAWKAREGGGE